MDPDTPGVGTWRGWGKYFLARKKRIIGRDPSESIHPTAIGRSKRAPAFEGATPDEVDSGQLVN